MLARKREAAFKKLQRDKEPQQHLPGWVAERLRSFDYTPGHQRLAIKPGRYRGRTPVIDSFDDLWLPGWNEREAMDLGAVITAKISSGYATKGAVEMRAAMDRFLEGPIPRQRLAQLLGVPFDQLAQRAKKIGAWLRVKEGETHPYEQLVLSRLGQELGSAYLAEVEAETAAQAQLLQIEFSRCLTGIGDHIGPDGAGWIVQELPFKAWRSPGGKLEWWAEVRCAVPGCKSNRIQVRALKDMRRSKAAHCRWCRSHPSPLLQRDKTLAWDEQHIPLVLREPARQYSYPLRAQGALALLEPEMESPQDLDPPQNSSVFEI